MSDPNILVCPLCGEELDSSDPVMLSSILSGHFATAHNIPGGSPAELASSEHRRTRRTAQPFADSGIGMLIAPDPSSLQTTENPRAASADARRGTGSRQRSSSPGEKIAEGVDWMKGMMNLKASTPTSTISPPTSNLMKEKAKTWMGVGDGQDASSVRGDLGRQDDRDRLLHTGAYAGTVRVAEGMPPTASSAAKEGEIGLECPVCGTVILARQMEDVNLGLREHTQRDHPRLFEPPLRS